MSLGYILEEVSREMGINLSDTRERARLVAHVNKAAKEIYALPDAQLPVQLKEVFVRVTANKELALPPFVGEMRAIRSGCTDYCTDKWELRTMLPRYNKAEWEQQWKNWRHKGYRPVAIEWLNTAPGTITYPVADSSVIVTIQGETENSQNAIDNVTLSATSTSWTKTFSEIKRISKNKVTSYDVVLTDAEGNEFAIIYADQLEARYLLVDVSQYPTNNCCACSDGTYIMEVLYKPYLPVMYNDEDFFPVDGFDDILALATIQLLTEKEEGKEQRAMLMHEKKKMLIRNQAQDKTGNLQKRITFKGNRQFGNHGGNYWY